MTSSTAVTAWTRDDAARYLARAGGNQIPPADLLVSYDDVREAHRLALESHGRCVGPESCEWERRVEVARRILLGEVMPLEGQLPL